MTAGRAGILKLKNQSVFAGRPQQIITDSRVLVCSLDPRFREPFEADGSVYLRHYPRTDALNFSRISDFLATIANGYDIVHLFSPVLEGGLLTDASGLSLLGSELIVKCCRWGVKLLWIANENSPATYIRGFKAGGQPLNLIMTIERHGVKFDSFLDKLLCKVSYGEVLPIAWTALVPQAAGTWQEEVPSCIFFAGRPEVALFGKKEAGKGTR